MIGLATGFVRHVRVQVRILRTTASTQGPRASFARIRLDEEPTIDLVTIGRANERLRASPSGSTRRLRDDGVHCRR